MSLKIVLYFLFVLIFEKNILASNLEKSGDILRLAIPGLAYSSALYLQDKEGQYQFYKSFTTNVLVTYGLKYSVDKERPNGEEHSFPSGHTSMAFQGATFIHQRYGLKYSLLAYAGATYVAYSRVESDNHYVGDVIAGALIGSISSYYFTSKYKIEPIALKSGYGIRVSMSW